MGILTTLLQGLSGLVGGLNGTVGVQILGSGTIDLGSTSPVTLLYSPPALNNAHLVVLSAVLRLPNGTPAPTASGYPLQVSVRFNGVQGFVLVGDPPGLPAATSKYTYSEPTSAVALGTDTVITAQMIVPSALSKTGIIDVIGYGVSP